MYSCCIFVTWYCIYSVSNNFKKVYCYLCLLALSFSCAHVLSFCRLSYTMLQCNYFSIQDWVWMHWGIKSITMKLSILPLSDTPGFAIMFSLGWVTCCSVYKRVSSWEGAKKINNERHPDLTGTPRRGLGREVSLYKSRCVVAHNILPGLRLSPGIRWSFKVHFAFGRKLVNSYIMHIFGTCFHGRLAQMVERSLSMREARGSIPRLSILFSLTSKKCRFVDAQKAFSKNPREK